MVDARTRYQRRSERSRSGRLTCGPSRGHPAGGTAPKGWLAEVWVEDEHGPIGWRPKPCPWLADFGLVECDREGYPARTIANVRNSDATLWFGDWHSAGGKTTLDACRANGRPFLLTYRGVTKPSDVRAWLVDHDVGILNVAGNRESIAAGIGQRVEAFLGRVFASLGGPV